MYQIPIQTLCIIGAAVVVFLVLVGWGCRRYARRHIVSIWRESGEAWDDTPLTEVEMGVTIAVISQGGGHAVENQVPVLTRQRGLQTEIIVVDVDDADVRGLKTSTALDRLATDYPNLRRTYVPQSVGGLDPYDVGCMLAARAARYEWMVIVSPFFRPASDEWLLDLMQYADSTLQAVADYGNTTDNDDLSFMERRRLRRRMLRQARKGGPVDAAGGSLLVQRDWFLRRMAERADGECLYLLTHPETHDRYAVRASCR